jgi:metal-dependent amidase/aminoacylase/carboxypeptidase family protein
MTRATIPGSEARHARQEPLCRPAPALTEWRRDLHRHPELSYEEHRTADLVARRLRDFGCDEVVEGIGRTGVVGVIRGRSSASGRVVGLRADMDALPILEATGAPLRLDPARQDACLRP